MAQEHPSIEFARGEVISRKYEIEAPLGRGPFGASYLARHTASGQHVAIKFLDPELVATEAARERLRQAFAKAKAVRHPGLCRYGELGEHNGVLYVTQEYFKSQSLRAVLDEHLQRGEIFTLQEACQIVIKVLEALQAAHDAGLVHRNVKPENILVHTTRSGPGGSKVLRRIRLTGLGLADILEPTEILQRFENRGEYEYLAPELVSFGQVGTAQADIYSCGVILYELLCGQTPKGTYLSPSQLRDDLPEHVDDVVELALAHKPEDRYPSAADMIRDIQRSFNLEMQSVQAPTSYRNVMLGLLAAVVVLAGVGIWSATRETEDPYLAMQARDAEIRQKVQAANPLPTEEEVKQKLEGHEDMVYVPGGTFVMGRLNQEPPEQIGPNEPLTRIEHVAPFYIDRFEYPNRLGSRAAAKVTWVKASEICARQGKRLCTVQEWEKACKGPGNFIYAYGDTWDPTMCGDDLDPRHKSGEWRDCVSGYGVFDMSGGLREWTASSRPSSPDRKIVKGGHRGNAERGSRCAFMSDADQYYFDSTLGFRCCMDAD